MKTNYIVHIKELKIEASCKPAILSFVNAVFEQPY